MVKRKGKGNFMNFFHMNRPAKCIDCGRNLRKKNSLRCGICSNIFVNIEYRKRKLKKDDKQRTNNKEA